MATVISVHSFRGGTGKSNTTANLAAVYAQQGRRVAVIDTDIQSPGIELEYLEQVARVTGAAAALESGEFDPAILEEVATRTDALGLLARRFGSMAREVRAREERLRAQVRELRIEIDHARQAEKVAEITETDFFRDLRSRAADLRRIVHDEGDEAS